MKKNILILIIYLVGCVLAYSILKNARIKSHPGLVWTVGERKSAILWSGASWLIVGVGGAFWLFDFSDKTPAKW